VLHINITANIEPHGGWYDYTKWHPSKEFTKCYEHPEELVTLVMKVSFGDDADVRVPKIRSHFLEVHNGMLHCQNGTWAWAPSPSFHAISSSLFTHKGARGRVVV
jgi:hypothetical protein